MSSVQTAGFQFDLDTKAIETDDGLIIEGLAADYEIDRTNELFEPGAFEEAIKVYMETNPVLLFHHRKGLALGQVIEATLDQKRPPH